MGINPIEYKPWSGRRVDKSRRFLVISWTIANMKLRSGWILGLLILAMILVHVFPMLIYPMMPHEELEPETMVGEYPDDTEWATGYIIAEGDVRVMGALELDGWLRIDGDAMVEGNMTLAGNITGQGIIYAEEETVFTGQVDDYGVLFIEGQLTLNGTLALDGFLEGGASAAGNCTLSGQGVVEGAPPQDDFYIVTERYGGYLKNMLLVIFTMILAALVCSDLISEDLDSRSFVLYFSRPLSQLDYLAGKFLGALAVVGIFSFLPAFIFCIEMIATQSGSDYAGSVSVLGSTILAGLLTTFLFIPYCMLLSSMTKKKTFAAIGGFMSLFVLFIVGNIFANFDPNWLLLDPSRLLFYSFDIFYGFKVPPEIDWRLLAGGISAFIFAPLVGLYLRMRSKGVAM